MSRFQVVVHLVTASFTEPRRYFVAFQAIVGGKNGSKKRTEITESAAAAPVFNRNVITFDFDDEPSLRNLKLNIGAFFVNELGLDDGGKPVGQLFGSCVLDIAARLPEMLKLGLTTVSVQLRKRFKLTTSPGGGGYSPTSKRTAMSPMYGFSSKDAADRFEQVNSASKGVGSSEGVYDETVGHLVLDIQLVTPEAPPTDGRISRITPLPERPPTSIDEVPLDEVIALAAATRASCSRKRVSGMLLTRDCSMFEDSEGVRVVPRDLWPFRLYQHAELHAEEAIPTSTQLFAYRITPRVLRVPQGSLKCSYQVLIGLYMRSSSGLSRLVAANASSIVTLQAATAEWDEQILVGPCAMDSSRSVAIRMFIVQHGSSGPVVLSTCEVEADTMPTGSSLPMKLVSKSGSSVACFTVDMEAVVNVSAASADTLLRSRDYVPASLPMAERLAASVTTVQRTQGLFSVFVPQVELTTDDIAAFTIQDGINVPAGLRGNAADVLKALKESDSTALSAGTRFGLYASIICKRRARAEVPAETPAPNLLVVNVDKLPRIDSTIINDISASPAALSHPGDVVLCCSQMSSCIGVEAIGLDRYKLSFGRACVLPLRATDVAKAAITRVMDLGDSHDLVLRLSVVRLHYEAQLEDVTAYMATQGDVCAHCDVHLLTALQPEHALNATSGFAISTNLDFPVTSTAVAKSFTSAACQLLELPSIPSAFAAKDTPWHNVTEAHRFSCPSFEVRWWPFETVRIPCEISVQGSDSIFAAANLQLLTAVFKAVLQSIITASPAYKTVVESIHMNEVLREDFAQAVSYHVVQLLISRRLLQRKAAVAAIAAEADRSAPAAPSAVAKLRQALDICGDEIKSLRGKVAALEGALAHERQRKMAAEASQQQQHTQIIHHLMKYAAAPREGEHEQVSREGLRAIEALSHILVREDGEGHRYEEIWPADVRVSAIGPYLRNIARCCLALVRECAQLKKASMSQPAPQLLGGMNSPTTTNMLGRIGAASLTSHFAHSGAGGGRIDEGLMMATASFLELMNKQAAASTTTSSIGFDTTFRASAPGSTPVVSAHLHMQLLAAAQQLLLQSEKSVSKIRTLEAALEHQRKKQIQLSSLLLQFQDRTARTIVPTVRVADSPRSYTSKRTAPPPTERVAHDSYEQAIQHAAYLEAMAADAEASMYPATALRSSPAPSARSRVVATQRSAAGAKGPANGDVNVASASETEDVIDRLTALMSTTYV